MEQNKYLGGRGMEELSLILLTKIKHIMDPKESSQIFWKRYKTNTAQRGNLKDKKLEPGLDSAAVAEDPS